MACKTKKLKKAYLGGEQPLMQAPYQPGMYDSLNPIVNGQFQSRPLNPDDPYNTNVPYNFQKITSEGTKQPGAQINPNLQQSPELLNAAGRGPKYTQESKYQFGINYNNILGSHALLSAGSFLANNSENSMANATKRFNQQFNFLPFTSNNSQQSLYGMKKGGMVKYDLGGGVNDNNLDTEEGIQSWMFEEPTPGESKEPINTEAANKAVEELVNPNADMEHFASLHSNQRPSYYRSSKANTASMEGVNPDLNNMFGVLSGMFPGLKVTSTTGGKHMAGSRHYDGRAIDIGANSSSKEAYSAMQQYFKANPGFKKQFGLEDIIDEGDHTHIELPKQKMGGKTCKYKEGGSYNVTQEELNDLIKQGYKIEYE